jgi:hypothetical protein
MLVSPHSAKHPSQCQNETLNKYDHRTMIVVIYVLETPELMEK